MEATRSLLGLYKYDNTVLDGLHIPEGLDAETLKDNLLVETAELEVLYSSASFMKSAIEVWSQKMLEVWTKQYATTKYEYNPIDNYDRYEEWTDKGSGSRGEKTTSSSDTSGSTVRSGSAYNERDFVERDMDRNTGEQSADFSGDISTENSSTHSGHIHGNIGVTTTQSMIKQEREIVNFNMYNIIINDFISRFCLLVY